MTQLIAHDREVYDVAWSPASREVFASVGADGSVRMFDLRSLEHSTILYEAAPPPPTASSNSSSKRNGSSSGSGGGSSSSPNHHHHSASSLSGGANSSANAIPSPLLRLAFSPTSPTYLSVVHADSGDVQILDTRSPGTPAFEIKGHKGAVNGMAWGGQTMHSGGSSNESTTGPGWLATVCASSRLSLSLSRYHCCRSPSFHSPHEGNEKLTREKSIARFFDRSGRCDAPPVGPHDGATQLGTDVALGAAATETDRDAEPGLLGAERDQLGRVGRRRRVGRDRLWQVGQVSQVSCSLSLFLSLSPFHPFSFSTEGITAASVEMRS